MMEGIFLFARLVLDYLKDEESHEALQKELDSANFPTDLEDMYVPASAA